MEKVQETWKSQFKPRESLNHEVPKFYKPGCKQNITQYFVELLSTVKQLHHLKREEKENLQFYTYIFIQYVIPHFSFHGLTQKDLSI